MKSVTVWYKMVDDCRGMNVCILVVISANVVKDGQFAVGPHSPPIVVAVQFWREIGTLQTGLAVKELSNVCIQPLY